MNFLKSQKIVNCFPMAQMFIIVTLIVETNAEIIRWLDPISLFESVNPLWFYVLSRLFCDHFNQKFLSTSSISNLWLLFPFSKCQLGFHIINIQLGMLYQEPSSCPGPWVWFLSGVFSNGTTSSCW